MSFDARCPECNTTYEAEDEWLGLEAECPNCQETITIAEDIPAEQETTTVDGKKKRSVKKKTGKAKSKSSAVVEKLEEKKIKKVKATVRNLKILGIIAAVLALLHLTPLIIFRGCALSDLSPFVYALLGALGMTVALFLLAVAADRGETIGMTLMLITSVLYLTHIPLLLVTHSSASLGIVEYARMAAAVLLIVALIIARSNVKDAANSPVKDKLYAGKKKGLALSFIAGVLFGTALVFHGYGADSVPSVITKLLWTKLSPAEKFIYIVQTRERAFSNAMPRDLSPRRLEMRPAMEELENLRVAMVNLERQLPKDSKLKPVVERYLEAIANWQLAVTAMADPFTGRMQREDLFLSGATSRDESIKLYRQHYGTQ